MIIIVDCGKPDLLLIQSISLGIVSLTSAECDIWVNPEFDIFWQRAKTKKKIPVIIFIIIIIRFDRS